MTLNVKDPEAHRLAQAIAQQTGETMTRAVTEALRERYERLHTRDSESLAADIRAIAIRAEEPNSELYIEAISQTPRCRISAGNFIELSIVIKSQFDAEVAHQCD